MATSTRVFLHFRAVSVLLETCTRTTRVPNKNAHSGAHSRHAGLRRLAAGTRGAEPVFSPRNSLSLPGTGLRRARRPGPSLRSRPGACSRCSSPPPTRPRRAPPLSRSSMPPELGSRSGFRPAAHNNAHSQPHHSQQHGSQPHPRSGSSARPARAPASGGSDGARRWGAPAPSARRPAQACRLRSPRPSPSPLTSAFCQPVSLSLSPSLLPFASSLAPEHTHLPGPGSAPSSLLPLPPSPPRPEGSGPGRGSLAAASPPPPQTRWTPPRKVSGGARALAPAPGFGPGPRPGRGARGRRRAPPRPIPGRRGEAGRLPSGRGARGDSGGAGA